MLPKAVNWLFYTLKWNLENKKSKMYTESRPGENTIFKLRPRLSAFATN